MLVTEEYLKVSDIAKEKKITSRTVRNKIQKLIGFVADNKIVKDKNDEYRVHKSILNQFEPQRVHKTKYTAITIDPVYNYTTDDLKKIMIWVLEMIGDEVEINYSIEQKKANGNNHLHIYTEKNVSNKFLKCAKVAFPKMSFHLAEIYDLEGWKSYMKKETQIITINKNI